MVDFIRLRIDYIESVPQGFILDDQYKDIPPDLLMYMPKIAYKINGNGHPLTFTFFPNEKRAMITGSIRKWHFGPCSINDFSRESFLQAVMKLQEQTGISLLSNNGLTRLTCAEFGVNLIGLNGAKLINAGYQAGRLCRTDRIKDQQLKLTGQRKLASLYNKSLEILKREGVDIQIECLRAELRLWKNLRMEIGVNTLLGVYSDWDRIAVWAYSELKNLKFDFSRFSLLSTEKHFDSVHQLLLAYFIHYEGVSQLKQMLSQLPISRSTIYNQLKQAEKLVDTLVPDNRAVVSYLEKLKDAFGTIHSKGILCLNN